MKTSLSFPRSYRSKIAGFRLAAGALFLAAAGGGVSAGERLEPIKLAKSGGFEIGGKVITNPSNPNQTLSCDHGYVEYFTPWKPRKTSLVMWHSSSSQVWQNRWDGGEGYKDKFLRRDYPVFIWDGPRVGRANWSCEPINYVPAYRDQGNFVAWKFGPLPPEGLPKPSDWYPGVQFPTESAEAWNQATRARYDEFDTGANIQLQTDVAAVAADSGKLGDSIVYLTNSAGGLRAMVTTTKAQQKNIAGIVTYESIGYVFPEGDPETPTACTDPGPACAFGPIVVPLADFKKLAKLKGIQFVWGDNRPETDTFVKQSRVAAKLINKYGGNAKVLVLGRDAGLWGSTHIPFADLDNDEVAALLDKFLKKNGLDKYGKGHDE
ncbi:alpha/beta fold hydrolase [Chelatococcus sambhunathii]|uniref:Alpha/beta fold hydrolase n=1 Tax=Chelatococcus sambhunathii TaxID=363953 RepID=A0ABU1DE40_9HYPH|nr:alpha/beta fold hydrolase [Chelatococcus sambhunathii]MDR4306352.1 alpha/beta fold hydrolase [Chelatococcus sambhunathii]